MISVDGGLVVIGGSDRDFVEDGLFRMSCPNGINDCKWLEMSRKLKTSRKRFVAMSIPDELFPCT